MESPDNQNEPQDERAKQIEDLLDQADKLIEKGGYDAAFELIRRAQSLDTGNRHALAFVGRIQRLMSARKGAGGGGTPKPGSQYAPSSFLKPTQSQRAPEKQGSNPLSSGQAPSRRSGEDRQAAIRTAIEGILSRAREYRGAKNYERALAEIERARLLDPKDPSIDALATEIRNEMEARQARMGEEQLRRAQVDEERKREALEQEIERIRREKEAKRNLEEAARKEAQQQRLQHYLTAAEKLIAAGKLDDAANQLAFVVVIDPLNQAAGDLQRKIREIHEQKRQEELELRRRKEAEEQQRQDAVRVAVQKNIETATVFAAEKKFNDALRVITRAYMLDPLNEEVRKCEQRILEAQEEIYRNAEEERRAAEEAARHREEEELRRLTEAERERLLQEQEASLELEKQASKEKVVRHLALARQHIEKRSYHDALAEVAQAFSIDPFDEDVQRIEQEIMAAQKLDESTAAPEASQQQDGASVEESDQRRIAEHLETARKFREEGELARALDELTKAFALDPLNDDVRALESEIEVQLQGVEQARKPVEPPRPKAPAPPVQAPPAPSRPAPAPGKPAVAPGKPADPKRVAYHVNRARRLMESGSFEDALAEVALGLTLDPSNAELKQMEETIWEVQNIKESRESKSALSEENERLIRIHLAAAEQFQSKGDFGRALDEIAKAYQVDPLNAEIKERENQIRQEELRRDHPDETPLKLVYPKKGAAGGSM